LGLTIAGRNVKDDVLSRYLVSFSSFMRSGSRCIQQDLPVVKSAGSKYSVLDDIVSRKAAIKQAVFCSCNASVFTVVVRELHRLLVLGVTEA
jgi:hypothetical protein